MNDLDLAIIILSANSILIMGSGVLLEVRLCYHMARRRSAYHYDICMVIHSSNT